MRSQYLHGVVGAQVGMLADVTKTKTLILSRQSFLCTLEMFIYPQVIFTSGGKQEAGLDARIVFDVIIMPQHQHSSLRREGMGTKFIIDSKFINEII